MKHSQAFVGAEQSRSSVLANLCNDLYHDSEEHALILSGPWGIGKEMVLREMERQVNRDKPILSVCYDNSGYGGALDTKVQAIKKHTIHELQRLGRSFSLPALFEDSEEYLKNDDWNYLLERLFAKFWASPLTEGNWWNRFLRRNRSYASKRILVLQYKASETDVDKIRELRNKIMEIDNRPESPWRLVIQTRQGKALQTEMNLTLRYSLEPLWSRGYKNCREDEGEQMMQTVMKALSRNYAQVNFEALSRARKQALWLTTRELAGYNPGLIYFVVMEIVQQWEEISKLLHDTTGTNDEIKQHLLEHLDAVEPRASWKQMAECWNSIPDDGNVWVYLKQMGLVFDMDGKERVADLLAHYLRTKKD